MFKQETQYMFLIPVSHTSALVFLYPFLSIPLSLYFIYLFRHNQRSLTVQKDPVHKNRCHVRFPEVFSSYPYIVNVTAINALGKTSNTYSFEESNIGKTGVVSCFLILPFKLPVHLVSLLESQKYVIV